MKVNRQITFCVIVIQLIFGFLSSVQAQEMVDKALQAQVDHYTNMALKIKFLSSVIRSAGAASGEINNTNNVRISSAITLLGQIGGTNVIDMLITNLTFLDKRYNGSPASRALVSIGEPAAAKLLDVLKEPSAEVIQETSQDMRAKLLHGYKESPDESRVRWAALTIGMIEGSHWKEFEEQQKKTLPKKAWDRLMQYVVIIGNPDSKSPTAH